MPHVSDGQRLVLQRIHDELTENPMKSCEVKFARSEINGDDLAGAERWIGVMLAEFPPLYKVELDMKRYSYKIKCTVPRSQVRQPRGGQRLGQTTRLMGGRRPFP